MKKRIEQILSAQSKGISFEEKEDTLLVNLDCYAVAGCVAEALISFARECGLFCVFTIQSVQNPHVQIILSR